MVADCDQRLIKNNRLISTHKNPFLDDELERPGEHDLLNVFSGLGHVLGAVGVADGDDALGDDGSFVEVLVDKVRGGADDLYAALIRFLVGLRADEGWKKGVVYVDNAVGEGSDEFL